MALLFLSMIVLGATAHRLLEATSQKTGALHDAEEHQRILAELEEVHYLRERMLQQGKALSLIHLCTPIIIAFAPRHPGVRNPLPALSLLITETASKLNLIQQHACSVIKFERRPCMHHEPFAAPAGHVIAHHSTLQWQ